MASREVKRGVRPRASAAAPHRPCDRRARGGGGGRRYHGLVAGSVAGSVAAGAGAAATSAAAAAAHAHETSEGRR